MDSSLVVIAWGLAAVALNTVIGRWCRAHPPIDLGDDVPSPSASRGSGR